MTVSAAPQSNNRNPKPRRPIARRHAVSAAIVAAVIATAVPTCASAAGAPVEIRAGGEMRIEEPGHLAFLGVPSPSFTPGLPPPQVVSRASANELHSSTRTMAAGVILVLFSGLAALTLSMWRDLGRRVGAR